MVFCGKCGTKNPDDNHYCRNCGHPLGNDVPDSPMIEKSIVESPVIMPEIQDKPKEEPKVEPKVEPKEEPKVEPKVEPKEEQKRTADEIRREYLLSDPDVESIDDSLYDPRKGDCVVLKRTEIRLSRRRLCQIFSFIFSLASVAALFLIKVNYNVSITGGMNLGTRSLSILEIAEMNTDASIIIYALVAVIVVLSLLGLLSPGFLMTSVVGYAVLPMFLMASPFYNPDTFNLTYYSPDISLFITIVAVGLGVLLVTWIPSYFQSKCVYKDGNLFDRGTSQRYMGLIFNVDVQWYKVWRKR